MPEMPEEDVFALEIETLSVVKAVQAFRENTEKARLSDSKIGKSLLELALPPLIQAIRKEQEEIEKGARPRLWRELIALAPDVLAFLTLQTILEGYRGSQEDEKHTKYTSLSGKLAKWVRLQYDVAQSSAADRLKLWLAAKHDQNPSRARKRVKPFLKKGWEGERLEIQLGAALLALAVEHGDGLFELYEPPRHPNQPAKRIRITKKGLEVLAQKWHGAERAVRPKYLPCLGPPVPWEGTEGGGYRTFLLPLVKRDDDDDVQAALKKANLQVVCQAVNAIQATPYRINQDVFGVLSTVADARGPKDVLPFIDIPPMPPRLPEKTTPEAEFKKRRTERYRAGRLRRLAARNFILIDTRLSIARTFGKRVFYFPHQVDNRSRAYPVPGELHPQSDDMSRGLLEFANGKELGERGAFWLAVHLANLWGHKVDKLPMEARARWVKDHETEILDSASRPLDGAMFWAGAEKRWRFLAASFEWAGYVREGPPFVSHLPIAMDGTCNGMQHLSALGRDPVGGVWTNLVPGETPQDLYQEVSRRLQDIVDQDAKGGLEMAALWQPMIKRSLVKQATMTTPYGVTLIGMKKQVRGLILEDAAYRARFPDDKAAADYLGPRVNRAIGQVVVQASEIRKWLKKIVLKLVAKDQGLSWTVPSGFPVLHEYRELESRRVLTVRGNQVAFDRNSTLKIRTRKMTNSIVPNLVHSLDATHMMFTVCALKAMGLSDFSMVHDSYAVHARDVDLMQRVLREQFLRVHNEFNLPKFLEDVKKGAPGIRFTEKNSPPTPGSLDLMEVLKSEYFFS